MTVKTDHISWLGHDSVLVRGAKATVYFDPWEVTGPPADLILITHDHFDHLDPPTVKALSGSQTRVVADADSAAKLKEAGYDGAVTVMEPGDEIEAAGVNIKAVPAYNLNKDFHPRSKNNLGYVVTVDGVTIYHAGDTDFIPEMAGIKAQIALLPVSGTYVMTADEAVEAALALKPEVAIPFHYGKIVGDADMARHFAEKLQGRVAVEIKSRTV